MRSAHGPVHTSSVHSSAEQLRARLQGMLDRQAARGQGGALGRARLALAFVHHAPDLILRLDGRSGSVEVNWDSLQPLPDLVFELSDAQTAHAFWMGELNVMAGLRSGRIKARGNLLGALALLPDAAASQAAYREAVGSENSPQA